MCDVSPDASSLISPDEVAVRLPVRPIVSAGGGVWDRAVVHRFRHSSCQVDIPPTSSHVIGINLGGPTLVEVPMGDGRFSRHWAGAATLKLTPAGEGLQGRIVGKPDVLLLHITPGLIIEVESQVFGPVAHPGDLPPQVGVADEQLYQLGRLLLLEASDHDAPGNALNANLLVRIMIVQLLRRHKHGLPPAQVERVASSDPRIGRVLEYMRDHFRTNITAVQLARLCGASQSSFSRLFREAVGQSAYQHLLAIRLEHALKLLEETTLPVTKIAFECGFGQPTHFATLFRERFGVGPRGWRRANTLIEVPRVGAIAKDL